MKTTIEPTADQSQPLKKQWDSPKLMLIATNNINGGAAVALKEENITSSRVNSTAPSVHTLFSNGHVGHHQVNSGHTKHFYHS